MDENSRSNAFVVLIQIQGTEFHIDKEVRTVWKVPKLKDFNDILMRTVTQLPDCP